MIMKKTVALGLSLFFSFTVMAQHTVVLKTGEKMNGMVESMKEGVISFKFKGNEMKLKVSDVSAVYFDEKAAGANTNTAASSKGSTTNVAAKEPGEKTVIAGSYVV